MRSGRACCRVRIAGDQAQEHGEEQAGVQTECTDIQCIVRAELTWAFFGQQADLQEGRVVGDDVRVPAAVQRVQLRADLLAQLVGLHIERDNLRVQTNDEGDKDVLAPVLSTERRTSTTQQLVLRRILQRHRMCLEKLPISGAAKLGATLRRPVDMGRRAP